MSKANLSMILVLLLNVFLSVGQAKELKGNIINIIQDDEGVKVVLDNKDTAKESAKKQPQICYLRNDQANFAEILTKIQNSQQNQTVVIIQSTDDKMPLIKDVSELKK